MKLMTSKSPITQFLCNQSVASPQETQTNNWDGFSSPKLSVRHLLTVNDICKFELDFFGFVCCVSDGKMSLALWCQRKPAKSEACIIHRTLRGLTVDKGRNWIRSFLPQRAQKPWAYWAACSHRREKISGNAATRHSHTITWSPRRPQPPSPSFPSECWPCGIWACPRTQIMSSTDSAYSRVSSSLYPAACEHALFLLKL